MYYHKCIIKYVLSKQLLSRNKRATHIKTSLNYDIKLSSRHQEYIHYVCIVLMKTITF